MDGDPRPLVRVLLHSDGCRVLNWVNGTPYPRYHWRPNNPWSLSVARRRSVALLDGYVGPKR